MRRLMQCVCILQRRNFTDVGRSWIEQNLTGTQGRGKSGKPVFTCSVTCKVAEKGSGEGVFVSCGCAVCTWAPRLAVCPFVTEPCQRCAADAGTFCCFDQLHIVTPRAVPFATVLRIPPLRVFVERGRLKLQAPVYDILPLEEGAGERCSECEAGYD